MSITRHEIRKISDENRSQPIISQADKLAANYLAFVQLASIRLWLRVNGSAS